MNCIENRNQTLPFMPKTCQQAEDFHKFTDSIHTVKTCFDDALNDDYVNNGREVHENNCRESEGQSVCCDDDNLNQTTKAAATDNFIGGSVSQDSTQTNLENGTVNLPTVDSSPPPTSSDDHQLKNGKEMSVKSFSEIPGPWPSLPFIGTGWQYFPFVGKYDLTKLHEAYADMYHKYGPILKEEYQWGMPIVHIFDPVDFETLLRAQGRSPIRPVNEFVIRLRKSKLDRYPNVGLTNLNGEEWYHHRQTLAPAIMKLKTINASMYEQNVICEDFLQYLWCSRDPETSVVSNLQEATYRLSLESICMLCLDNRIGSFEPESPAEKSDGQKMIEATKLMFDSFNRLLYGIPFWKIFSTSAYEDMEHAESVIYTVASKYVDKAIENLLEEKEYCEDSHSVLQTLLITKGMKTSETKIAIIDFMVGGIFTIANTLPLLIHALAANQEVQQKLFEEIETVMKSVSEDSDHDTSTVVAKHIAKMPYLKACVQELFRYHATIPGVARCTSKPLVLSGYHIPQNTTVFAHVMTTCRLENYFKDANIFRPERWLDPEERNSIHPFSLLPFGFGNRMCVGKRFTESEIYMTTIKLIREFKVELVEEKEIEMKHSFIVIPANPISIRLIPRRDTVL